MRTNQISKKKIIYVNINPLVQVVNLNDVDVILEGLIQRKFRGKSVPHICAPAALAAAKSRGVRLGNPNGAAALKRAGKGGVALRETVASNADAHAAALAPVIAELQRQGYISLRALARELNTRGMRTRRGG